LRSVSGGQELGSSKILGTLSERAFSAALTAMLMTCGKQLKERMSAFGHKRRVFNTYQIQLPSLSKEMLQLSSFSAISSIIVLLFEALSKMIIPVFCNIFSV
jgi:hypothetical protein